jgi:hypothetical protein
MRSRSFAAPALDPDWPGQTGRWLAALARLLSPERRGGLIVTPATLLRWHRDLARRRWQHPHRAPGLPPIGRDVRELILRFARENPRLGYPRIGGELAKLAITASPSTVRRILLGAGLKPAPRRDGPTWREFLHAQAAGIIACDFFCIDTMDRLALPLRQPRGPLPALRRRRWRRPDREALSGTRILDPLLTLRSGCQGCHRVPAVALA